MVLLLIGVLALLLAAAPKEARAWGTQGHQVVANLAQAQLSVGAKREVDRLLATEPGQPMASISTWADEHRNPVTAAWHYVNFPKTSCTYSAARDRPDGLCARVRHQMTQVVDSYRARFKLATTKGSTGRLESVF